MVGRRRRKSTGSGSGAEQQQNGRKQHSSSEEENEASGPEWKRLYGKCSANEIYHIRLSDSRFFGEYQGKSFTYASFHSHRKFGVALIGVQTDMRGTWPIMLNPGPSYVLKSGDILFYINITKEENSTLMPMMRQEKHQQQWMAPAKDSSPSGHQGLGELCALEPRQQQQQQQSEPARESSAGATSIRVESSSPTVPQQQQQGQESDLEASAQSEEQSRVYQAHILPKKHSVAEGASIVARSLCSVAGIASADLPLARLEAGARSKPAELQHLAANLLAKRNSSASTSAALGTVGAGLSSRNVSTLELAALATGLRKGSNLSITSTKSRDVSPTRLKQVVSGLAVKMKRVKLGKSLTHLTIPRMDYGGSSASSTESFVNARGRRPSIAPVPAMMGESEEHDSDHEREQESYFAMSWQSSSESSA